ncbi:hypothetical protein P168DRAFT_157956 [Aspergillus campestris IBT 28561]|uniref:Uncharacterized protein n=1 Tax=Aspergillus campestris (strain IBT 28561) TaxID=1392248 RepID=A0A2I1D3F2_ASPC2|nr:uncharacterized protein P168DRAFT_157956 [Aspergillus campestris IBT 28561]PKY04411.1 hypothetical protein P168DRAFT_157956 [Aspergillus campestris IBT 28561]
MSAVIYVLTGGICMRTYSSQGSYDVAGFEGIVNTTIQSKQPGQHRKPTTRQSNRNRVNSRISSSQSQSTSFHNPPTRAQNPRDIPTESIQPSQSSNKVKSIRGIEPGVDHTKEWVNDFNNQSIKLSPVD